MGLVVNTLAVLLLIPLATALYRLHAHPLRHYPGPRWWAATRLPWLYSTVRGTIVRDLQALHEQYGPVVRVAPNELSYTTPAAIRAIYQSNPEFPKDPMDLPPEPEGVPGILSADHDNHRRYRRLLANAFSDRSMRAQQGTIQSHVDLLITRLRERSAAGESVDLCEWFNWATFDIIGDLAFGEPFGCLDRAATHDWIASIQANVKSIPVLNALRRLGLPWLIPLLAPRSMLAARARNARYAADRVDRRRRHGAQARGDLWDGLIAVDGEDTAGMTRDEMVSNASALVLAGSETSATLLAGCTWLLLRPENAARLRRLAAHVRASFVREEDIDLVSVARLDYMLALVDEALRLYPPVPMQSKRIVRRGGAVIAGGWVPEGTSVALQLYAACHSRANFHRPDEFLPERWMADADADFAADRREVSQPFSVGPRNCIGRQLAYAEIRLILAKILWHFDLELDCARMDGRDWMAEQKVWILWDKGPLWVYPKLRKD